MNYETIEFEQKDSIGFVVLNRPKKMNAMNNQFFSDLESVFHQMKDDKLIKVVIITGKGKCFSAGADIQEVGGMGIPSEVHRHSRKLQTVFNFIDQFPKPVIAAINGFAVGGGLELALACDLRVASSEVYLAFPEIKLGVIPGAGGTQRLPRLIGITKAKEMIFTGEPINADEALKMGLLNQVTDAKNLMTTAVRLASQMKDKSPLVLKMAKIAINRSLDIDLDSGLELEAQCQAILSPTKDREEGMRAFLEKRSAHFLGE